MGGSPPPGEKSVAARTRSHTPTRGPSGRYAPLATSEGGTPASTSSGLPAILAVFLTIPGLFYKPTTVSVRPETYLAASGQAIFLTIAIAWTMAFIWNPAILESNPLKDRIGFNNPCSAWDSPPALFPAGFLMTFCVYCMVRYNIDNLTRAACSRALSPWRLSVVRACSITCAVSACFLPLLFVVTPAVDPNWHTAFFTQYIGAKFIAVAGNFIECYEDEDAISTWKWIFLGVYGFFSLADMMQLTVNFYCYEGPGENPTIPPALGRFADHGWFACLAVTQKFLPSQPPLKVTYELDA